METLGISLSEKPFYDIADHDLLDVWESDIGSSVNDPFRTPSISIGSSDLDPFWTSGLIQSDPRDFRDSNSSSQIVRNDRLLTDSVYERRLSSSSSSQQLNNNNNINNNNNSNYATSSTAACNQQQLLQQQHHQLLNSQFSGSTSGPVKTEHSYSLGLLQGGVGSDGDSLPDSPISMSEDMDTDCYSYLSFRPAVTTCSSSAASLTDPDLLQSYSSSSSSSSCGSTSAESCLSSDEGSSSTVKEEPPSRPASPLPSVATLLPPTLQTIYQQHPQTIGYLVKDENEQKFSLASIRQGSAIFLSPHSKKARICSPATETKMINIKLENDQGCPSPANLSILDCDLRPQKGGCLTNNSSGSITLFRTATTSTTKASPSSSSPSNNVGNSRNVATTKVVFGQTSVGGSTRHPIQTSLISYQPKGATGELCLTEEEKRTLISEGYPVPQRLPLTKSEEKSLKKIRRKIKNKISAQESRRKKKEYMDTLEKRMDGLSNEVDTYRQKCVYLEQQNSALQLQVQKLQAQLSASKTTTSGTAISNTTTNKGSSQNQRSKN